MWLRGTGRVTRSSFRLSAFSCQKSLGSAEEKFVVTGLRAVPGAGHSPATTQPSTNTNFTHTFHTALTVLQYIHPFPEGPGAAFGSN